MRKFIFYPCLLVSFFAFSQYGSNIEYKKFTNKEKKFNDWSVTLYAGIPLMQSADLTSFNNQGGTGDRKNKLQIGYDLQLGITKHITHSFAIQLLGQMGEARQGNARRGLDAKTNYYSVSLLGDLNLSMLVRRVDNKSPFRWAFHMYGGAGFIGYKTKLRAQSDYYTLDVYKENADIPYDLSGFSDLNYNGSQYISGEYVENLKVNLGLSSFFFQAGAGVKYKISRRLDLEWRVMYLVSGDNTFDGGGAQNSPINALNEDDSDDLVYTNLGLSLKIGKHKEHLQWFDPLQELYPPAPPTQASGVCMVDKDDDAVCDDLDKQLDSPKGCRVDGSGIAMDTDYDGLIDCQDKCPTVPGPVDNQGCPIAVVDPGPGPGPGAKLPAIEFLLDSDKLTNESRPILDNAAKIIKEFFPNDKIIVEGHTDAWATPAYNLDLSQRRTETVIRYLETKGVNALNLIPVGKGMTELKLPQCNPASKCTDAQNKQNRRVIFKLQN